MCTLLQSCLPLNSYFIDFSVPDKLLHKIFLYFNVCVCALLVPGNENWVNVWTANTKKTLYKLYTHYIAHPKDGKCFVNVVEFVCEERNVVRILSSSSGDEKDPTGKHKKSKNNIFESMNGETCLRGVFDWVRCFYIMHFPNASTHTHTT